MPNNDQLGQEPPRTSYDELFREIIGDRWSLRRSGLPSQMVSIGDGVFRRIVADATAGGLPEADYRQRLIDAQKVLRELCDWSDSTDYTDVGRGEGRSFWYSRANTEGFLDRTTKPGEMNREVLEMVACTYLDAEYMHTETLSSLIVDALVFAEVMGFKKHLLLQEWGRKTYGSKLWKWFGISLECLKWGVVAVGLYFAHQWSGHLFTALAIAGIALFVASKFERRGPSVSGWSLWTEIALPTRTVIPTMRRLGWSWILWTTAGGRGRSFQKSRTRSWRFTYLAVARLVSSGPRAGGRTPSGLSSS